ncbi:MAG: hypothetical protein ABI600_04340 [Luteolibacter sp.]
MPLPFIHSILGQTGGSAFDEMLRLIGIAAIIVAFFRGVKSLITKPAPPPIQAGSAHAGAVSPTPAPVGLPETQGVPPEIVALIAAAVSSFTGRPHRIISIRRQSTSWEKAGRQSVLSSHRIR